MTKIFSQPIDMETLATKKSSHIITMNETVNIVDKLSYTKAIKYIDRKINEFTNKKSYDKINKQKYVDDIKQLQQKRKEINKKIEKLENENNKLNALFDVNKQLKQELIEIRKQKKEVNNKLHEEIKNNKYKNKILKKELKQEKKNYRRRLKKMIFLRKNKK